MPGTHDEDIPCDNSGSSSKSGSLRKSSASDITKAVELNSKTTSLSDYLCAGRNSSKQIMDKSPQANGSHSADWSQTESSSELSVSDQSTKSYIRSNSSFDSSSCLSHAPSLGINISDDMYEDVSPYTVHNLPQTYSNCYQGQPEPSTADCSQLTAPDGKENKPANVLSLPKSVEEKKPLMNSINDWLLPVQDDIECVGRDVSSRKILKHTSDRASNYQKKRKLKKKDSKNIHFFCRFDKKCSYVTDVRSLAIKHAEVHLNIFRYSCSICPARKRAKQYVEKHFEKVHPGHAVSILEDKLSPELVKQLLANYSVQTSCTKQIGQTKESEPGNSYYLRCTSLGEKDDKCTNNQLDICNKESSNRPCTSMDGVCKTASSGSSIAGSPANCETFTENGAHRQLFHSEKKVSQTLTGHPEGSMMKDSHKNATKPNKTSPSSMTIAQLFDQMLRKKKVKKAESTGTKKVRQCLQSRSDFETDEKEGGQTLSSPEIYISESHFSLSRPHSKRKKNGKRKVRDLTVVREKKRRKNSHQSPGIPLQNYQSLLQVSEEQTTEEPEAVLSKRLNVGTSLLSSKDQTFSELEAVQSNRIEDGKSPFINTGNGSTQGVSMSNEDQRQSNEIQVKIEIQSESCDIMKQREHRVRYPGLLSKDEGVHSDELMSQMESHQVINKNESSVGEKNQNFQITSLLDTENEKYETCSKLPSRGAMAIDETVSKLGKRKKKERKRRRKGYSKLTIPRKDRSQQMKKRNRISLGDKMPHRNLCSSNTMPFLSPKAYNEVSLENNSRKELSPPALSCERSKNNGHDLETERSNVMNKKYSLIKNPFQKHHSNGFHAQRKAWSLKLKRMDGDLKSRSHSMDFKVSLKNKAAERKHDESTYQKTLGKTKKTRTKKKTSEKGYKCGWCRYDSDNQSAIARHHRLKHPGMEMDIVLQKTAPTLSKMKPGRPRKANFDVTQATCDFRTLSDTDMYQLSTNLPVVLCVDAIKSGVSYIDALMTEAGLSKLCVDSLNEDDFISLATTADKGVNFKNDENIDINELSREEIVMMVRQTSEMAQI